MSKDLGEILLDFGCEVEKANKMGIDGVRHINLCCKEAKQAILQWAAELIGEDEQQTENGLLPDRVDRRNQLRAELRVKLVNEGWIPPEGSYE